MYNKQAIAEGRTALGIELGTTRIKAVLLNHERQTLASGQHTWENRYENGIWTYSLDEIWAGVRACYAALKEDVRQKYGVTLIGIDAIGISAMMHGYMVFDRNGELLAPFRTWRNNNAEFAAAEITKLFYYNIPARWSIAHLYQSILNKEPHVADIAFQTTLEGYIHWKLTEKKVIGIGEASGMFPLDYENKTYNRRMTELFDSLPAVKEQPWKLLDIFPAILKAGDFAGNLTKEGAKLLDLDGDLKAGVPFCPPEGDAGTGMVATNSVRRGTGNVSAGTSIFGMFVLDKELSEVHREIDIVATPCGESVAMVHCNNCTSEINAWVDIFGEFAAMAGRNLGRGEIFDKLLLHALKGDADCGGVLAYNYLSGENITAIEEGRPLLVRTTESKFNLANFVRAQLFASVATFKIGFDILLREGITVGSVCGHGGIFKTEGVFQRFLAAALGAPVTVAETANEGGAYGMAVLALYMLQNQGLPLADYLEQKVFAGVNVKTVTPDKKDTKGFARYMDNYIRGLPIVKEAVKVLKNE